MYLPSLEVIQSWLLLNHEWLGPTIAFMALIEALVVVGLLIPGVAIMFALGAMAGAGVMDPLTMLLWGIIGSIIGDGISFQLGYHYHNRVRFWWPFNKHPEWLKKGEEFFHSHGDLSIALGRFIGPVRPIVPVVAGMLDMSPTRFYIVNILSAIPWAPVYLMPGFLAGAAVQSHGAVPVGFFGLILTLVVMAILLPTLALRLKDKFKPAVVIGYAVKSLLFLFCTLVFLEFFGVLAPYNFWIGVWIEGLRMPYLEESMRLLTWLGCLSVLCVPLIAWLLWTFYKYGKKSLYPFIVAFIGMEASYWVLKYFIDSPRPSLVETFDPFSFPSGHTTQATFILIWLGIQWTESLSRVSRILVLSITMMLVFCAGLSRMVLGFHWVGDVIAGFVLGLFWLCMTLYLTDRSRSVA